MIDYDDFLVRVEKIVTGTGKEDVRALLGEPEPGPDATWHYDLRHRTGFPGIPPVPGTTVFLGIDIVFENDRVKNVSKSWIDATGPARP